MGEGGYLLVFTDSPACDTLMIRILGGVYAKYEDTVGIRQMQVL